MIEPNRDNIYSLLMAMGDDELDAAECERLRQYLSCHPELVQWLADQRQMTAAAGRVVRAQSPATPDALRRRIASMARETAYPESTRLRSVGWLSVTGRAIAATLLVSVGLLAGWFAAHRSTGGGTRSAVIPASIVAHASRVHADCSRLEDVQHAAAFPQGDLARDVQRDLAGDHPWPDLRAAGFRYVGAGPCGDPLQGAVHLLYRTLKPGSRAALSVFVQRFDGQYDMQLDKVYTLTAAESPFPTLAWRTGTVAYVLVAEDDETARKALAIVRGRVAP